MSPAPAPAGRLRLPARLAALAPRLPLGAFAERNFRYLFVGRVVSALGDRITPIALAFAVLGLTGSPADLGYVLAAQTIPTILFVLAGGVWSDRLPRHYVMLASDVVRGVVQVTVAILLLLHVARIWELVVLAAVYGAADAFFTPASTGIVPLTVSSERLLQANALLGLSRSTTAIVGPAVAGLLVALAGPATALAADGGTFFVSAASLALLRIPRTRDWRESSRSVVAEALEGWQEIRSRSWLSISLAYFGIFNLAAFPTFFVLGPYVADRHLGGASAWATALTAGGVGALVGGAFALRTNPRRPLAAHMLCLFGWWPPMALLAIPAPAFAIAAAVFVAFVGLAWASALWTTTVQQRIPDASLSRVSAFDWLGSFLLNPVGFALVGPISARIGVGTTLAAAAAISGAATLAALAVPAIRRLPRIEPAAQAAPGTAFPDGEAEAPSDDQAGQASFL